MITGDQALTACHVASQVHIISKPALILTPSMNGGFEWVSPDETERTPFRYNVHACDGLCFALVLFISTSNVVDLLHVCLSTILSPLF